MNKNKIFSAIMRLEVSGINALSSAAGSSSVNGARRKSSTSAADLDTTLNPSEKPERD
ncbi:MAG: hypothetical protein ACLUB5_00820 [Bifidobacterium dentium]